MLSVTIITEKKSSLKVQETSNHKVYCHIDFNSSVFQNLGIILHKAIKPLSASHNASLELISTITLWLRYEVRNVSVKALKT